MSEKETVWVNTGGPPMTVFHIALVIAAFLVVLPNIMDYILVVIIIGIVVILSLDDRVRIASDPVNHRREKT